MAKKLFIAEKPSVAREFAKALKFNMKNKDGYLESEEAVVTWCVGHLVTMSYPDKYDSVLKKWSLDNIPFLPTDYKYEVIEPVKKQFGIVSSLLKREDIDTIYVCTDSGREGEYIYRLVEKMVGPLDKTRKRVWIDSQTEDEILRGIREAKNLSEYDNLSDAAFLRAKEDYLMGINFSRVLTLTYGQTVKNYLQVEKAVISVGRVMTCVLGMVVNREREVRAFQKTPFYRVLGEFSGADKVFQGEWKAVEGSKYYEHPALYKENGFKEKSTALSFIDFLKEGEDTPCVYGVTFKKETKNPPLLYNLAELQNDCSKLFKISPDETLKVVQELYEKKLVTYPRTDARVLSSAVAKEIHKNLQGLKNYSEVSAQVSSILEDGSYKKIAKSRYVNDKQITDHYAIIPTGYGAGSAQNLSPINSKIYEIIAKRFVSIFLPSAIYRKATLDIELKQEHFITNYKYLESKGFLVLKEYSFQKKVESEIPQKEKDEVESDSGCDEAFMKILKSLKKGQPLELVDFTLKEGETSPPKRYNSGSIILAMENAGQLIEDEELRAQIKSNGIGTSATRAEILKKLVTIGYLSLHKKTQILTPTFMGECIFEVVDHSIKALLNPELTASWEKGLELVAKGEITEAEYMTKLDDFVGRRTNFVKDSNNRTNMVRFFEPIAVNYKK